MRGAIIAMLVAFGGIARADSSKEVCIAADTHAQELRREGKLREALSTLDGCTDASCPAMIRGDCTERVDEIRRAMPTVVFDVKTSAHVDVADTHVEMDGHPLLDRLDGRPTDVDPGDHTFALSARGATETVHLLVHEGDKERVVAWTIAERPPVRTVLPSATPRILGLAAGGVGLVSIAAGAIFGALTIADHATVRSTCPNDVCLTPDAFMRMTPINDESRTFGTISNIAFIAGAVLTTIGVVVFVTAPRRPRVVVGLTGVTGTF